jgi:hypothetical protein
MQLLAAGTLWLSLVQFTARSHNDVITLRPFLGRGHTQKSLHTTHGGCLRFHCVQGPDPHTGSGDTMETRKMLGKQIAYH